MSSELFFDHTSRNLNQILIFDCQNFLERTWISLAKRVGKIPCRISFSWLHFFCRFVQTKKTCPIVLSYVVLNSAYMVPLLCLVNPSVPYPIFSIAILTPEGSEKLLDLILSYHVGTYVCISFSFNSWICFLKSTYL